MRSPRVLAALACIVAVPATTACRAPSTPPRQPPAPAQLEAHCARVVVDESEPPFIVFTGIPDDTDETKLDEIRDAAASRDRVTLLSWDEFVEGLTGYASTVMLRNDYPDINTTDGLACLVARMPGSPWGLTWNGGIALTFSDYQHARSSYSGYVAAPDTYRPRDARADPVNPLGVLPAAGCLSVATTEGPER